jgi:diazepam-binding inhibitor (GABA receptor modulator, acyl-CoA-binding protein)
MLPSLTQRAIPAAVRRQEWIEEDTMDDMKARFERAAQEAQQLPRRPDNTTLLQLYALYKQASSGDVSGARPGILDMQGRMKYDAWAKVKGTASDEAMRQYVELVERLKAAG